MDIRRFNAEWLRAWTEKDVPRLLEFYAPNVEYRDSQVPMGLKGLAGLKGYLEALFAATPPMAYEPDEVWHLPGGYCGRWYCTVSLPDGSKKRMRGFDLVMLEGDRIVFNEVYTHALP